MLFIANVNKIVASLRDLLKLLLFRSVRSISDFDKKPFRILQCYYEKFGS